MQKQNCGMVGVALCAVAKTIIINLHLEYHIQIMQSRP
jgi:hypothetical protein